MNIDKFFVVDKRGFEDNQENREKLAAIADYFVDNGAEAGEGVMDDNYELESIHKYIYPNSYHVSTCHFFGVNLETHETLHINNIAHLCNNNFTLNLDEAVQFITKPEAQTLGVGAKVKTVSGKGEIVAEGVDNGDEVWVIQLEDKLTMFTKSCDISLWTEFDDIYQALQNSSLVNGILSKGFYKNLYDSGFLKKPE